MGQREDVHSPVTCECGNKGAIHTSESANPVFGRGLNERLEEIVGPFTAKGKSIQCDACEAIVYTLD